MNPQKILFPEAKLRFGSKLHELDIYMDQWARGDKSSNFLVYEGKTILQDMNLETEEYDGDTLAIIINGDLQANNIYNFETDYGMNLIVLGSLTANNIAVAGQNIHVKENLTVSEIFMGCYNHGIIFVSGNVVCPTIIIDDYHFCVTGDGYVDGNIYGDECVYFSKRIDDKSKCPNDNINLHDVFNQSVIGEYGIDFCIVSRMIADHQNILLTNN